MNIVTLVENTAVSKDYSSKHGLCFYIETGNHRILYDLGPNRTFLQNAKTLSVDIGGVDTVTLFHGHIDYGGALNLFLKHNFHANIFLRPTALQRHKTRVCGLPYSVGLPKPLERNQKLYMAEGGGAFREAA